MQSNHLEILVDRLEKEIGRHHKAILDMQIGKKGLDKEKIKIHQDYIDYSSEMVRFVKKLDKEIHQNRGN